MMLCIRIVRLSHYIHWLCTQLDTDIGYQFHCIRSRKYPGIGRLHFHHCRLNNFPLVCSCHRHRIRSHSFGDTSIFRRVHSRLNTLDRSIVRRLRHSFGGNSLDIGMRQTLYNQLRILSSRFHQYCRKHYNCQGNCMPHARHIHLCKTQSNCTPHYRYNH